MALWVLPLAIAKPACPTGVSAAVSVRVLAVVRSTVGTAPERQKALSGTVTVDPLVVIVPSANCVVESLWTVIPVMPDAGDKFPDTPEIVRVSVVPAALIEAAEITREALIYIALLINAASYAMSCIALFASAIVWELSVAGMGLVPCGAQRINQFVASAPSLSSLAAAARTN